MMEIEKPVMTVEESGQNASVIKIVAEPLERGYGITLGNALRRASTSVIRFWAEAPNVSRTVSNRNSFFIKARFSGAKISFFAKFGSLIKHRPT